jgi:NAD(P)-dependent dehydrogenase (short-subunit alcohol dehydrogenase family)
MDYNGKIVMVTGAAGGLGQVIVEKFHDAGAKLALIERQKQHMDETLGKLRVDSANCLTIGADATDPASMRAAVDEIVGHYGRIDVLVHAVGGYAAGQPVHQTGLDVWDKMMTLNATAVYVTCAAVAGYMVEAGVAGRLVVVLARAALKGSKNHAAYTASKAAAQRVVESMAAELLDHGITVNGVMPSTIDTPANRQAMPNADFTKWVTPAQIADAVLFLASDAASAISGDSLAVYNRS